MIAPRPSEAATPGAPLKITPGQLIKTTQQLHFVNDGDAHERQYWPILKEHFPNCERFWQSLVVPLTQRIGGQDAGALRIARRSGIADDVWNVSYLAYSLFLHLAAAFDHLTTPMSASFGDFYTHLGSACDLAEEFLLRTYFIVAECSALEIKVLQSLTKAEFVALAEAWYDKHYPNLYQHYLRYGKGKLDWPPFLRQTVKTQNPSNGELSHGSITQAVHAGI